MIVDFEDIGGVYNNNEQEVAENNRKMIQDYFDDEAHNSKGIVLRFSGPTASEFGNKRVPGNVHIDVRTGSITNPRQKDDRPGLLLEGIPGTRLIVRGARPNRPLFKIIRSRNMFTDIVIRDLTIAIRHSLGQPDGWRGSGIWLKNPGSRTILQRVAIQTMTRLDPDNFETVLGARSVEDWNASVDLDGWTDIDDEDDDPSSTTAPYGIFIDNADGCYINDCVIRNIVGHGMIVTRWHDAKAKLNIRECLGAGLKGIAINGARLLLRAEFNYGYGMHLRECGNKLRGSRVGPAGAPSSGNIWFEANNARGKKPGTGHSFTQCKLDHCSRLTLRGHSGWRSNMIRMSEGTRRSIRLISDDFIDPSCQPVQDLKRLIASDIPEHWDANTPLVHNIGKVWAGPSSGQNENDDDADNQTGSKDNRPFRPSVELINEGLPSQALRITIPRGAWNNVSVKNVAYFNPMAVSSALADLKDGDFLAFECEAECDSNTVGYCMSREVASAERQVPWTIGFGISPFSIPNTLPIAFWSTRRRKFSGKMFVNERRTLAGGAKIQLYTSGNEDRLGGEAPTADLTFTIHEFKVYRITVS